MTATSSVAPVESTTAVRARDRGGILDLAFRLYRKQFLTVLAIVAVLYVPAQLIIQPISIWLTGTTTALLRPIFDSQSLRGTSDDGTVASLLVYAIVTGILPLLQEILTYPSNGALTLLVEDNYIGRPVSFVAAYRRVWGHIGPLIGLMCMFVIISAGAYVIPGALMIASQRLGSNAGLACMLSLAGLLPITYLLFIAVRFFLAVPAATVEGLGPVKALRRSWELIAVGGWRGAFGLLVFTLGLLSIAVSFGPVLLTEWLAGALFHLDSLGNHVVSAVVGSIGTLLFLPIRYLVISIYYFDLRIRQEGYDLDLALGRTYPHHSVALPDLGREGGGS